MIEKHPFIGQRSSLRSLNRAMIMALPEVIVEEGVCGRSGYELLAAQSLMEAVAAQAHGLGLEFTAPDLLLGWDACFQDPGRSLVAVHIARTYGRKLGYLLLMLKRADPQNRAARPEWADEQWRFWQEVSQIIVGGGLVSGRGGGHILAAAQQVLGENGCDDLALVRSPYPAYLPLIGTACLAPISTQPVLVMDFGHTMVKRAIAYYQAGQLTRMRLFPSRPAACDEMFKAKQSLDAIQARWLRMAAILQESWQMARAVEGEIQGVGLSLATYLFQGHPTPTDIGCYGGLQLLSPNLEQFITHYFTRLTGRELVTYLAHDGTAAAATFAGQVDKVVLILGTAIGSGFPPPAGMCRPLAAHFALDFGD